MNEISVYFVATPIGNLAEITYRAVETLKSVDAIYCEDTRRTLTLLNNYGIAKPLFAYHKFNEKGAAEKILSEIGAGKKIAVVSDAGMPCVSDPGNILVKELIARGIGYTVISGACAFVNAFVLSGFPAPFVFIGFLPEKNSDRKKLIETLPAKHTLIFYSSVHDVNDNLKYLADSLGDRKVCVARELTKIYETVYFGNLSDLNIKETKGEFVIIVGGDEKNWHENLTVEEHIEAYIKRGLSKAEAVKRVARDRNVPKNEIYQIAIKKP